MKIKLDVNDKLYSLEIAPGDFLSATLRSLGLKGVKIGCSRGNCGCCAVIVDKKAVNSCQVFTAQCAGSKIYTIESLGTIDNPHPIQKRFVEAGSAQCGFCNPGTLMAAKALLDENPKPTRKDISEALDGNLCRCTGYVKRIHAIFDAAKDIREGR